MSLEKIQKVDIGAFEVFPPQNAEKTDDLSKSTVPITSGEVAEVNLDNPLEAMGLEISINPDIPPTPANRPDVKGVPLPKNIPGHNEMMAGKYEKNGNNIYYYNDDGMVEKIYQNDGKLKYEIGYYYDKIAYYRYYNYDSNGNMIQEILHDLDEKGNITEQYVRQTIERDAIGRRTRTIEYNIYGEPNCWWEHEYDAFGLETDYECHPNIERDKLGKYANKWFDDSEFYLNGK